MNLNDIMGRKDAAAKGTPVEQYRKTIGKHDWKKDKSALTREMKQRSEAKKSAMSIQEVLLILGTFLALIVCVYFFFYMSLSKGGIENLGEEPHR